MLNNLIDRIKLSFRKDKELYSSLYAILGFYPRHIDNYKMALMHKSIMHRNSKGKPVNNERLEFLGDAILDAIVGDIVYHHFPGKREGFLTNTRSKLVQRDTLNKLSQEMGIDQLILSNGHSASHNSYLGGNAFEALVGGIKLSDQEIRNCVYRGRFNDFVCRLSEDPRLRSLTSKPKSALEDGTYEELVLRFFAYLYGRDKFVHNVKDFLNDFMNDHLNKFDEVEYETIFHQVFEQLSRLEHGIVKAPNRKQSSTVFWEAITVGAAEAIKSGKKNLNLDDFYIWVADEEFNKLVTGATNSSPMLEKRIKYAKDKFCR